MYEKTKWVWYALKCGAASCEAWTLYSKLGSIDYVYFSDYDDYLREDVPERLAESLSDKSLDEALSIVRRCDELGVEIVCFTDEAYPKSLRVLPDAPVVLYCIGDIGFLNSRLCIAMVGTRSMSEYGKKTAYKIE